MECNLYLQKKIALLKASAVFGSQSAMAKFLKKSRSCLNHWINWDMFIPFEYIELIEEGTQGKVTREQLGPNIDWNKHPRRTHYAAKVDDNVIEVAIIQLILQPCAVRLNDASSSDTYSLPQIDLNQPILIDITGIVIDGAKRVLAFEQQKKTHITCKSIDVKQLIKNGKPIIGLIEMLTLREEATLCVYLKSLFSQRHGHKDLAWVENFPPYKGLKSREITAMVMGYGNVKVPEQLEKVLTYGIPELFPAIENKHIALSNAVLIAVLPKHWQRRIIHWPKRSIITFCNRLRQRKQQQIRINPNKHHKPLANQTSSSSLVPVQPLNHLGESNNA